MPRPSLLITVFTVSFLAFTVWLAPAALLVSRVDAVPLGPGQLQLSNASGRVWSGQAHWRWQRFSGTLQWDLDWRGISPGVQLKLRESGGRMRLAGWLSPGASGVTARDLDLKVPVATVTRAFPRGGADGEVTGRIATLEWQGNRFDALSGKLRYSGGRVHWGADGSAEIPALDGRLFMEGNAAIARVTGPEEQSLAEARVADGKARFRVFRAWPALLGASGGGNPDDVVFEVTRPLNGAGE